MEASRLALERAFHDRQAAGRASFFAADPHRFWVDDDKYLDHATWIRPALERLGPVAGRRVLDYGCGHGMMAVVLARRGARVTAFDLSGGYIAEAKERARQNHIDIDFAVADGERLPFADGSFDCIWGNGVLHHLDLAGAALEIRRVLRPGGRAVFCEPWGGNPFLEWVRRHGSYPEKDRTSHEAPLRRRHVNALCAVFPNVQVEGFQLLGMVGRLSRHEFNHRRLDRLDRALLNRMPGLSRFCRYVVITMRA
jgi:SAM-dependent methyltransferase